MTPLGMEGGRSCPKGHGDRVEGSGEVVCTWSLVEAV